MNNQTSRKISPDKKFYIEKLYAGLQVVSRGKDEKSYVLGLNNYDCGGVIIFRWSADSKAIGVYLGKINERWIGVWYPFKKEFFTVHVSDQTELIKVGYEVDSIEILADERKVICSAKGKKVKTFEIPTEKMLTVWEKQKLGLETQTAETNKKEWTWNEDQYGYEGVHLYEGQVLWFTHTHNPHGGGGANGQSFEDFLTNGASNFIPGEFLPELYDAVKILAGQKEE